MKQISTINCLFVMKTFNLSILILIVSIICINCKKSKTTTFENCFTDSPLQRVIINKIATVKLSGQQYYIIEQNAIDTKLVPCNLPNNFKQDNLQVILSGNVKSIPWNTMEPCFTAGLEITSISL